MNRSPTCVNAPRTSGKHEAIERGRDLLEASLVSLDRSQAALERTDARANRDQEEIRRETAATSRDPAKPSVPAQAPRAAHRPTPALRQQQLVTAATRLPEAQEKIARSHEEQAARQPAQADQCRQSATAAQAAADRAREIALQFSSEVPG